MKFRYIFLFTALLLILCSAFSCEYCKDKNCPGSLTYVLPVTLNPLIDTLRIGDSIQLSIEFPDELTDINGGIKNKFENYDFRLNLSCDYLDVMPPISRVKDFLGLKTLIGEDTTLITTSFSFYNIFPKYEAGQYSYKCLLFPKRKGLFSIYVYAFSPRFDPLKFKGACDSKSLEILASINNEGENNFSFLQYAADPAFKDYDRQNFRGGYCFYVK